MDAAVQRVEPVAAQLAGRKRRGVNRGRVDYATMDALADLQYALSKGDGPPDSVLLVNTLRVAVTNVAHKSCSYLE